MQVLWKIKRDIRLIITELRVFLHKFKTIFNK
jgi:hypothetical protein